MQSVCNEMPSTATLCSCFSRLTSQLAKSSLDDLGGSENQLDPASALLYEAFADIADCFTAQVELQTNSADVIASLAGDTLAPVFGYHKNYKFAAVVAGCVGTFGGDRTSGLIDFFTE
ncbi:hypothetical protein WJX75_006575 [Coccomyxa subellipsoidea]|uniref:Uncharacterized protein n=1 Tax=Coccomyxa subellipsoidea TaxID=248742 RepID=A0ABR2YD41_9CHLO